MAVESKGNSSASWLKEIFLFSLMLAVAFVFFAAVRNNPFWHTSDYLYLLKAIKTGQNWREIFVIAPLATFQPLINLIFFVEFRMFGDSPTGYYFFNVIVHSLNAYLVYRIVFTLLRDRTTAIMSGLLFDLAVGNYGKSVMLVSGISDLIITSLTLITLLLFFRNELNNGGRLNTVSFWGTLLFFALSLLSKATSFSTLGCMLAFNLFFRKETSRRVFGRSFLIVAGFAFVVLIAKYAMIRTMPGINEFGVSPYIFIKNYASYLVRMVFPIHTSSLVTDSGPLVRIVYRIAGEIRLITFLCILSYSVFGFIFGNRTIRFFIAWTYITVTPFCFFQFPSDWFNIRYLYLVSVGFVMILASGTVLATRLLYERAWRRFIPYLVPVLYVFLSQFVIQNLDRNYERLGNMSYLQRLRAQFQAELNRSDGP